MNNGVGIGIEVVVGDEISGGHGAISIGTE